MTEPKTYPRELLLFRLGTTETFKGPFELTKEAARLNAGKSVPIQDEDFGTKRQPLGWARTELRNDGLWLVDITWGKDARDLLDNKSLPKYLVPAFTLDGNRVEELVCAGVTNTPSAKDATRIE